jgi:hypothetical protein
MILTVIMAISLVDTVSSPSHKMSQIAGPAIGGVIAVAAGYLFTKWGEDEKEYRRKRFLATVFLSEIRKIQGFIAGIDHLNITSDDFLITRPPITDGGGLITRDARPEYDTRKYNLIVPYFHNNPYIRVTENSQLVSKKNPFEIFAQEIYSFEDSDLISGLFKIDNLMNEASSCLSEFHKSLEALHDGHLHLFDFMRRIERIKPEIEKILSKGKLESIANAGTSNL